MVSHRIASTALPTIVLLLAWSGCTPTALDVPRVCVDQTQDPLDGTPKLWTELHPTSSPPARQFHTAVFDEDGDRLIVFGGGLNGALANDVWVLSSATDIGGAAQWTELTPTGGPPSARSGHVAAYDAKNDRMIVFGGGDSSQGFNDVWVLANANGQGGAPAWTKLATTNAGPFRAFASATYDEATSTLYVFGGEQGQNAVDDAWSLSNANGLAMGGSTWTKVDVTPRPTARANVAAALDAANGRWLLVGGATSPDPQNTTLYGDVWTLAPVSGGMPAFAQLATSNPGPKDTAATLGFDPKTQRAVLFGGLGDSGGVFSNVLLSRTELLSTAGGTPSWARYETGNAPPVRFRHAAAYSSKSNRLVVFGGAQDSGKLLDDTWVLDRANGEPGSPIARIQAKAPADSVCATKISELRALGFDAGGAPENVAVVWTCSDASIVLANGVVVGTSPEHVTCTACLPDKSVCSDPIELDVTADDGSGGGGSSGSSSGSSGSSGSSSGSSGGTCGGCTTDSDCDGVAMRHGAAGAACGSDHLCHACFSACSQGGSNCVCIKCSDGCGGATCMGTLCAFPGDGALPCE